MRTKGLDYADKVEVDAVQVTVTVTDGKGKFVPGIPQAQFRIYEDGQPQDIGYFASEDVPLELVVAVDISGSMAAAMPRLKRTVGNFLAAVPTGNQVTLLGFNDSVFTLIRRSTDLAERVRAVDRLAPWGATALYDVIIRGIEMLGRQTGRRALVVFTDGEDQGSHVTLEDVERRLQASDVTLYMIGQGRGVTHDYLRRVMQRLTVPTGGRVFTTDNIDALQGRVRGTARRALQPVSDRLSAHLHRSVTTPGTRSRWKSTGSRSISARARATAPCRSDDTPDSQHPRAAVVRRRSGDRPATRRPAALQVVCRRHVGGRHGGRRQGAADHGPAAGGVRGPHRQRAAARRGGRVDAAGRARPGRRHRRHRRATPATSRSRADDSSCS